MKSIGYDEPYEEELYDFSTALDALKKGLKVTREGWNGKDMYLQLQKPDQFSKMTLPYIYMVIPQGDNKIDNKVPWIASQTDLLMEDWIVLKNIYMKKYCPDCGKEIETIIYNETTTPEILTCIECGQFVQQP